jgi:hypothetical protein
MDGLFPRGSMQLADWGVGGIINDDTWHEHAARYSNPLWQAVDILTKQLARGFEDPAVESKAIRRH